MGDVRLKVPAISRERKAFKASSGWAASHARAVVESWLALVPGAALYAVWKVLLKGISVSQMASLAGTGREGG